MSTREELEAEAENEGVIGVLSESEGEVSLDDLRLLPGAEGLDDTKLQEMWDEVKKGGSNDDSSTVAGGSKVVADQVAAATGGTVVKTARGYKVYGEDGKEVTDLSKVSAEDFLSKYKVGYNANKAEHRKSFDEMTRVAQFGHFNEKKLSSVLTERGQLLEQLGVLKPQFEQSTKLNQATRYALSQYAIGNTEPLALLVDAFKKNMGLEGNVQQQPTAQVASSSDEAEGTRVWYEEIAPLADSVAARFGAKQGEVRAAVRSFVENEPNLTREKLDSYINEEIPLLLQQVGYREGAAAEVAVVKPAEDVTALKNRIAELEAAKANGTLETVRAKNKKLPDSGRNEGVGNEEGENVVPAEAMKSPAAMKKWLKEGR